jgi:hypothetical protein
VESNLTSSNLEWDAIFRKEGRVFLEPIPHGLAFISLPGRKEDESSGVQIEPGTFIPQEGSEKGLPHHLFTEKELYVEFAAFKIRQVEVLDQNFGYALLLEKE